MRTKRDLTPFTIGKVFFSMIALVALAIGCSDDPPVAASSTGTLNIGVAVTNGANGAQITDPDQPTLAAQVSALQITSAKVVLSNVKIHSSVSDTLDFQVNSPVVVDLNMGGSVHNLTSLSVPAGTYSRTDFKIDALESIDTAAWNANADMRTISIRIAGYVEGNTASTFVWTSDLDEEQVVEHAVAFDVFGGGSTNLVIQLDHSQWFSDPVGGILDPRVAENHSQIENNFKTSFDIEESVPAL